MILTVTMNASIDKRYVAEGWASGKVNRVTECEYVPGGKGLNVSKPLAAYGASVTATGIAGGFAGQYILSGLAPLGIRDGFFRIAGESRSCINLWDPSTKTQTEFLEPGPVLTEEEFGGFLACFRDLLAEANVVTMSGSLPRGLDGSAYARMISLTKEAGKPVILDTSGKLLRAGITACPDMIKPNLDEIRMLAGQDLSEIGQIALAAERIRLGGVRRVAVSLGSEGAILASEEGVFRAHVPQIDAVNTVGCGDAMTAGFAIGMEEGRSAPESLRLASAISAASAMTETTGYFRPDDMKRLLPEIGIEQIN